MFPYLSSLLSNLHLSQVQFSCHGIIPLSVVFTVQSLHDNSVPLYTITNNTILSDNSTTSTNSVMIRSGDIDSIAHDTLYQVDLSIEYEGGRDVIKDITQIGQPMTLITTLM